jgi:hypothetical protein
MVSSTKGEGELFALFADDLFLLEDMSSWALDVVSSTKGEDDLFLFFAKDLFLL